MLWDSREIVSVLFFGGDGFGSDLKVGESSVFGV